MTRKKINIGFRLLDREARKRIASMGGKAAHKSGKAYHFTTETAKIAGRKGGLAKKK